MATSDEDDFYIPGQLYAIRDKLRENEPVSPISVRELLSYYSAFRRGFQIVQLIRRGLDKLQLETEPDFENLWIDGEIQFRSTAQHKSLNQPADIGKTNYVEAEPETEQSRDPKDIIDADSSPTFCIRSLKAANKGVVRISPDSSFSEAVTLMLQHDYSQLPVVTGRETVKGIISWSSIGSRLAVEKSGQTVRDYMDQRWFEVKPEQPVFEVLSTITEQGYVLVRAGDGKLTGIVTAADLSLKFQELAEPFLLCNEIEEHLRYFLSRIPIDDVKQSARADDGNREINDIADLTLGQLQGCLGAESNWPKLKMKSIDRGTFIRRLNEITQIRNKIMHFRLADDPANEDDLRSLRTFAKFLQTIRRVSLTVAQ